MCLEMKRDLTLAWRGWRNWAAEKWNDRWPLRLGRQYPSNASQHKVAGGTQAPYPLVISRHFSTFLDISRHFSTFLDIFFRLKGRTQLSYGYHQLRTRWQRQFDGHRSASYNNPSQEKIKDPAKINDQKSTQKREGEEREMGIINGSEIVW